MLVSKIYNFTAENGISIDRDDLPKPALPDPLPPKSLQTKPLTAYAPPLSFLQKPAMRGDRADLRLSGNRCSVCGRRWVIQDWRQELTILGVGEG
jgi:hypothetical protein